MRTSVSQFQLIVEFMERNGDLSKPTEGPQGRLANILQWAQLTEMLNADSTGDTKSAEKWRKVWSDMKNNTKKKVARIHRDATATGGGPARRVNLTDLEERVLNIAGSKRAILIPEIVEVGLSQEDLGQQISIKENSEALEDTENTFAVWSPPGTSDKTDQLPDEIEPPPPMPSSSGSAQTVQVQKEEDTSPIAEAPQIPTRLSARRRRRLLQTVPWPSRRSLARQTFVNSDNDWRVFQQRCEKERLRLRERELNQQDRWLNLFGEFIALGNRIVDTFNAD